MAIDEIVVFVVEFTSESSEVGRRLPKWVKGIWRADMVGRTEMDGGGVLQVFIEWLGVGDGSAVPTR